jgi:hypothetical protein
MTDLPPIDHMMGFRSKAEVREYLAAFADRPDTDLAGADLWGRPTTFGDLRQIAASAQESQLLPFEEFKIPQ